MGVAPRVKDLMIKAGPAREGRDGRIKGALEMKLMLLVRSILDDRYI